jgi:hypothetical protein
VSAWLAAIGSNAAVPASPSNLTAQAVGTTSVRLTWTNNASNQSGVVISLDGQESVDLPGATVSSYAWTGLSPNTRYWFYVASKIYGTPGDPTGYGNTQSAWVGPVYATTAGTQTSTSPAPQPSTSQSSTSPAPQPSTSPAPQPSTPGSGVPATLPTQPSPTFVCVTGPDGSCLQPGAGLPVPQTWNYTPPGWLTSPVTGGCVAEFLSLDSVELYKLFELMGGAIQFDESNGNFFVRLVKGLADNCSQLAYYLLTGKPVPQNLDFIPGAAPPPLEALKIVRGPGLEPCAAECLNLGRNCVEMLDDEVAVHPVLGGLRLRHAPEASCAAPGCRREQHELAVADGGFHLDVQQGPPQWGDPGRDRLCRWR